MKVIPLILQALSSLPQHLGARRKTLARFLVAGFVVMGVGVAVLMPPFRTPDEFAHWRLATTRLDRILHPSRNCAPFGDLGTPFLFSEAARPPHDRFTAISKQPPTCASHAYSKMYGGLLTYPGAVASLLLFTSQSSDRAEFIRAFFIGRLLQGLFVALVMWRMATLMLEKRTVGALVILGFPLAGLALQESFGITADGVGFAFALMLCAAMTSLDRFRARDVTLFAFVGYCTSIAKPFLTPVILPALFAGFVFMRPSSQSGALWAVIKEFIQLLVPRRRPSLLQVMVWVGCALCAISAIATLTDFGSIYMRVDPAAQKAFLLSHPKVFFLDLPKSVLRLIDNLGAFTGPLGFLDAAVSPQTVAHFRHLLYALVGFELILVIPRFLPAPAGESVDSREVASPLSRQSLPVLVAGLLVLVAALAGFYGVIASLYLTWTPRGWRVLDGFQTRYVIPHVLLLLSVLAGCLSAVLPSRDVPVADPDQRGAAAGIACGTVAAVLVATALLYFGGLYFDLQTRYF
ncbi:MAG: hypothetical protein ACLP66_25600 [Polyangia bacterium]|jgi:hypothetical protein